MLVRLIHNGRELRPDTSSLAAYNVDDLSVVHCLVTRSTRNAQQTQNDAELTDLDLSNLMLPLFTLILALIWYCRIVYRNFFNAMSTLALLGITVLYFFTLVVTWRTNGTEGQRAHARPAGFHPHRD